MQVFNLGSTLIRCATASSKILAVVLLTLDNFEGDTSTSGLFNTSRLVSGDINNAFVAFGSARRFLNGGGALPSGSASSSLVVVVGVGVTGSIGLELRFLFGVDGPFSVTLPCPFVSSSFFFRFGLPFAGAGAVAAVPFMTLDPAFLFAGSLVSSAKCAAFPLRRLDRLVTILKTGLVFVGRLLRIRGYKRPGCCLIKVVQKRRRLDLQHMSYTPFNM